MYSVFCLYLASCPPCDLDRVTVGRRINNETTVVPLLSAGPTLGRVSTFAVKTKIISVLPQPPQDNGGNDGKALLQQQNHELAVDMRRRKTQEAELEKKLAQAWAKQGHFDATLSAVNRAWNQVLLLTVVQHGC